MRLLVAVLMGLAQLPALSQTMTLGDMLVRYTGRGGFAYQLSSVPVIRGNSLQLYAPGWTAGYYSSNAVNARVISDPSGRYVRIEHPVDALGATLTETMNRKGPNELEVTLTGRAPNRPDVLIEWTLGYLNAFPLYGGSFSGDDGTPIEVAPVRQADYPNGPTVVSDVSHIRFRTRLGEWAVRVVEGEGRISLLDGRRAPSRWWNEDAPSFWIGFLDAPATPGTDIRMVVSVTFTPVSRNVTGRAATVPTRLRKTSVAFAPRAQPLVIIPKPKSLKWGRGRFQLSAKTRIEIGSIKAARAAASLQTEIRERFGWNWPVTKAPNGQARPGVVRIVEASGKPESYKLQCDPKLLKIVGGDRAGCFYGVQTLIQIIRADGAKAFAPACAIDDHPSLSFRGVHLFPGKDALPFHKRLVEQIFGRFKLNHLVLECSYSQWETNPRLWVDISVPKAQLREYVQYAQDHFLTPIPLVQSLGHAEWMFKNGQNSELAEDPDARYAYAATDPATYDFIGKVNDEAHDLFRSRFFHIGHDEVTMTGRYPYRAESRRLGVTRLFLDDVNRLDSLLKPRGVRLMLWGDMLLARGESNDAANAESLEEARKRREGIPRDSVICDWHYQPANPEDYRSLKVFKDAGLSAIACSWYNPDNIFRLAAAARLYDAWGLLQTTWAGYSITEKTLESALKQFSAYILAAEYAWSADSPSPDELPYNPDEVFRSKMASRGPQPHPSPGFTVGLDLPSLSARNVLGFDSGVDFGRWSPPARLGDYAFAGGPPIVLAGALLSQGDEGFSEVTLAVNAEAASLVFLQTTAFPAQTGAEVGQIRIELADGTQETISLRYGRNTAAWDHAGALIDAPVAHLYKSESGVPAIVRAIIWRNPRPASAVRRIIFATTHPYASPVLYGVTGLTKSNSEVR